MDQQRRLGLFWVFFCVGAALLSACGEDEGGAPTPQPEPEEEEEVFDGLTFHQDVRPLLEDHCWRCHYEGGQGPGDFTKPENVVALAPAIMAAIDDKRMPPPVSDPGCRDYLSAERMALAPGARDTIARWISDGMVLGDAPAQVAAPDPEPTLKDPDLTLTLAQGYAPTYADPRNAGNEYRCFALEHGQTEPFFITGLHPIVDQDSIVHHVVLAKTKRAALPPETTQAAGQDCISDMSALGDGSDGGGIFAAWAPGMEPVLFEDAGIKVAPDEVFVLQMHYYFSGPDAQGLVDRSGYALKTAPTVKNEIRMAPLGTGDFLIPAGDLAYTAEGVIDDIPVELTVWGVFPHMHVLGWQYAMSFGPEGEEQCLLQAERYDFGNQLTYMFKEPVVIPARTPIRFSCTWNNSTSNPSLIHNPPIDVAYGERTDEEMCYAFTYFSIGRPR
jgi:hypothetical protein